MNFKRLLKRGLLFIPRFIRGRLRYSAVDQVDIATRSGGIITDGKRKVAVYKDEEGNVTRLSPICTHMGCLVEWDKGEQEWVCPCHRSRFSPTGQVKSGPAKKDLEVLVST